MTTNVARLPGVEDEPQAARCVVTDALDTFGRWSVRELGWRSWRLWSVEAAPGVGAHAHALVSVPGRSAALARQVLQGCIAEAAGLDPDDALPARSLWFSRRVLRVRAEGIGPGGEIRPTWRAMPLLSLHADAARGFARYMLAGLLPPGATALLPCGTTLQGKTGLISLPGAGQLVGASRRAGPPRAGLRQPPKPPRAVPPLVRPPAPAAPAAVARCGCAAGPVRALAMAALQGRPVAEIPFTDCEFLEGAPLTEAVDHFAGVRARIAARKAARRHRLTAITVSEVSGVDVPANPHAEVVFAKAATAGRIVHAGEPEAAADLTAAMALLAPAPGRIGATGLFPIEGVSATEITVALKDGRLSLMPSAPRGAAATLAAAPDPASMVMLPLAHFAHADVLLPDDLQGGRAFGETGPPTLEGTRRERIARMATKHGATLEFMRLGALQGKVYDGSGELLVDLFARFAVQRPEVVIPITDFLANIAAPLRAVKDAVKAGMRGLAFEGTTLLAGPVFLEAIAAAEWARSGAVQASIGDAIFGAADDPLRRGVRVQGLDTEEYGEVFTLADDREVAGIPPDEALAFPTAAPGFGATFCGPAALLDAVNKAGREVDLRAIARRDGSGIDLASQATVLPVCFRPEAVVRVILA